MTTESSPGSIKANRSYKSKSGQEPPVKVKYENLPRLPRERALAAHAEAIKRGAKCEECPLFGIRAGPILSTIVPNSRLTIVVDGPRNAELEAKRPMASRAGEALSSALSDGGVSIEDCSVIHAVACRSPEEPTAFAHTLKIAHETACAKADERGEPHPPAPVLPPAACFPRFQRDMEEANSRHFLTLGTPALKATADYLGIPFGAGKKTKPGQIKIRSLKAQIGAPVVLENGTTLIATYHPSFAMAPGSRHYAHVIRDNMLRAAKIAVRGHIDWKEPDYILIPSSMPANEAVPIIESTLKKMIGHDKVIDIETDQGNRNDGKFDPFSCRLRCIGIGAVVDGKELLICVPIRHITGGDWWTNKEDKRRVVQACLDVLNDESINKETKAPSMLIGHNMAFDTSVLLRHKLLTSRTREHFDSMLAHRNTVDCDLPHGLGFVAARYFEVPSWKGYLEDSKYSKEENDYDLHAYNLKDCLTTLRLSKVLLEDLYRYNTVDQYLVDQAVIPVARDMGQLGLFIDEVKRGEFSVRMNKESWVRLQKLKELYGDKNFNPNSPHQIRKYLFQIKKYVPVINTKKESWAEGDDPATNTAALTKLVAQQGVDDETKKFINTLLEYRQFMKLKTTYVDKLQVYYPDWKKEFNIDLPMLPAVKGQVLKHYNKKERFDKAIERFPEEYSEIVAQELEVRAKSGSKKSKEEKEEIKSLHAQIKKDLDNLISKVEESEFEEVEVIPARPAISRLPITYKLHTVSSGRMACTPQAQNWPKFGKLNTHEMIICPPGHVMVGADLDQVELRLYAAIAADKLLVDAFTKLGPDGKPFDPHSLNAASMFAKKMGKSIMDAYLTIIGFPDFYAAKAAKELGVPCSPELVKKFNDSVKKHTDVSGKFHSDSAAIDIGLDQKVVDAMYAGSKKGDKEKKKLRGYAKTFCIAEGQLVLTDRGEVPIEEVKLTDLLWDGIEWVSHEGVIFKGEQNVIKYEGLWATPDHEVWAESGDRIRFAEAKEQGIILAKGSFESKNYRRDKRNKMADGQKKVRVYDILNAGPRHRFTVEGIIVSNCYLEIYGGSADTLFSLMSTARDKASGALMFPDLKESDVQEWHIEWHKTHPETKKWQQVCMDAAKRQGFTASPIGCRRKRFFPGGANKSGATANHTLQSSAAEIANRALLKIAKAIPYQSFSPFTGLCLQVHDFIAVYVPTEYADFAKKVIEDAMNQELFDGINITATAGVSDSLAGQ